MRERREQGQRDDSGTCRAPQSQAIAGEVRLAIGRSADVQLRSTDGSGPAEPGRAAVRGGTGAHQETAARPPPRPWDTSLSGWLGTS